MDKQDIQRIKSLILVMLICCMPVFCGCNDEDENHSIPQLEIAEEFLIQDFDNKKHDIEIPVITNLSKDEWRITSSAPNWCMATKVIDENMVRLYIPASEEPEVREAVVKVVSTIKEYTIKVRQLGYGPAILVTPLTATTLSADGGDVRLKITSNIDYKVNIPEVCDWLNETTIPDTRALSSKEHTFHIDNYAMYGEVRSASIHFDNEKYEGVAAECVIQQKPLEPNTDDVEPGGDVMFKPIGGTASQHQPGQEIEKCWDGLGGNNFYHSPWAAGATKFPVILEFDFDGTHTLDYFVYTPRSTGGGHWGTFDLYYATQDTPEYILLGSYDFKKSTSQTKLAMDRPLAKITKLKVVINTAKDDYVNCEEIEFYEMKSGLSEQEKQLLSVFTDLTCSEVRPEATMQQIQALPGYFINIAMQLKNGTYDTWEKKFRIQEYKPYSTPNNWADKLYMKSYTDLDNPTGIYVNSGDELIVMVGETYGNTISLQAIRSSNLSGDKYMLNEGINKLQMKGDGMLFVMYNTELTSENAKPVKIHIPLTSGTVSGYFDLERDKTDAVYTELLQKATYEYFLIKGNEMLLNFHRTKLLQWQPNSIVEYITMFDHFVNWQYELLGLEDIRSALFNNHVNGSSINDDSYMWAGNGQIGFGINALDEFMPTEKLYTERRCWGPAHEIGHLHQGAIAWTGCFESSNNLFSNYVLYKIGRECSNGAPLSVLADRKLNNRPFCNFLGDPKKEDTEIHMRIYWQLWLYFHRCGIKSDFYPELFKKLRNNRNLNNIPVGERQMLFVKYASDIAQKNLADFFDMWGFMTPVDETIEQYGSNRYTVTNAMIAETREYTSKYPNPQPFYYIEDRKDGDAGLESLGLTGKIGDVGHYTQFKENQKITKTPTYSASGQQVTIINGNEAVAFEIWKDGKRKYFSNFLKFTLPDELPVSQCTIRAVQADGKLITVERSK